MNTLLYNGKIITPWRVIDGGHVFFSDEGQILGCGPGAPETEPGTRRIDAGGRYISPGFIDIHTHGAGGHDFMDGTAEAILAAARTHMLYGTTTLVPTTVSATNESLFPVLEAFSEAKAFSHAPVREISPEDGDAAPGDNPAVWREGTPVPLLWGLHLEGPYFNPEQKGAMDEKYVRNPDMGEVFEVLKRSSDIVRWSIAPELPGALEMAGLLRGLDILPSMGHTMAVHEEAVKAHEAGFSLCTHLYSAMSGVRRINAFRHGGVVEAAFVTDDMDVEIIADGAHLPPELLKLICRTKGPGRIALVTDSMRAAGQEVRESILGAKEGGLPVIIEDGVAKLPDRTAFAGSVATADRLVRTMVRLAGAPIEDAVRMLTATPARIMNMKSKGRICAGFDADLAVFDGDINISQVWRAGVRAV